MFQQGMLGATGQTLAWMVVFFFASRLPARPI
jgi:hypothetical protein